MFAVIVRIFFKFYISFIIRRDFRDFTWNQVELDHRKSVLMLANHFSWWDGFLLFHLNRRYLKRKFYVLVSEENYQKISFLKYLGAVPLKTSRGVFDSLQEAGALLNDPANLLLVFPQGRLYANSVEEVAFEKGILRLINASDRNFQYLFACLFVDYFNKRKPGVWCYLQACEPDEYTSLQLLKNRYNKHYQGARLQHHQLRV